MSKTQFFLVTKLHWMQNTGLMYAILRMLLYSTSLLFVMGASERWFQDTYTANIGLFMLCSAVIELLSQKMKCKVRFLWYAAVVIGLFVAGLLLLKEGMCVQAQCHGQSGEKLWK